MQKIIVTFIEKNGNQTQRTFVKNTNQPVKVSALPNTQLQLHVDGLAAQSSYRVPKESDQLRAKSAPELKLKRIGNDLVVEGEGAELVQIVDYHASNVTLGALEWNYADPFSAATANAPSLLDSVASSSETQKLGEIDAKYTSAEMASLGNQAAVGVTGTGDALPSSGEGVSLLRLLGGGVAVAAATATTAATTVATTTSTTTVVAPTLLTVSGTVVAGPVISGNGLTVVIYDVTGKELGRSKVQNDGTYTVSLSNVSAGTKLIARMLDADANPDYYDEGQAKPIDLTSDLLAAGVVPSNGNTLTLNVTKVTTVAALQAGVPSGYSGQNISSQIKADVVSVNKTVGKAFGVVDSTGSGVDVTTVTPVAVIKSDGSSNTAFTGNKADPAQAMGAAEAAISGAEATSGASVITTLASDPLASGAFSAANKTTLTAGATTATSATPGVPDLTSQIKGQLTAPPTFALGKDVGNGATSAEATQVGGVVTVSAEQGKTVAVTFTDVNGHTVTKTVTATGASQAVSLSSSDLGTGANQLQDGAITVSAVASDGTGATSNPSTTTFTLDTKGPAAPTLTLGAGVSGGATQVEATQTGGVVTVNAESGSTVAVTFTDSANHTVTKTITGTGTSQAVTLSSTDLGTGANQLQEGIITVKAVATDAAGNIGSTGSATFTLDNTAPSAIDLNSGVTGNQTTDTQYYKATDTGLAKAILPNVALPSAADIAQINITVGGTGDATNDKLWFLTGTGANMWLQPQATTAYNQTNITVGGVVGVDINRVAGSSIISISKNGGGSFTAAEVQTIEKALHFETTSNATQGGRTFSITHQDAAGNISTPSVETISLDTVAPTIPTLALGTGISGGATSVEATQTAGVVTVKAESGSAVAVTFTDTSGNKVTKNVTGTGASQAVTLTSADLGTGTNKLLDGTITVSAVATDGAGNASSAGTTAFTLDTATPAAPTLVLGTGVSGGATSAEATQTSGVVILTAESGSTVAVTFSDGTNTVTKTVTGTGASQAVTLTSADIGAGKLQNNLITVSAVATDAAGNTSSAGTTSFTLDTVAPTAPTLTLGTGVSGGATSAEATQTGGVVTVSAESGSTVAVTFTDGTNTVTKTVTGTGASQAVTLTSADLGTGTNKLLDGTITVSAVATDAAGNPSSAGTTTFKLDTTAPNAVDLNKNSTGTQTADTHYYSISDAGTNKAIVANVDLVTEADIAQINIAVGGPVADTNNDKLVFGTITQTLGATARFGSGLTINGVSGLTWNYSASKILSIYKTSGAVFTAAEVQAIEQGLSFQTATGTTQGSRTFSITHIDAAGNTGATSTQTITVAPSAPAVTLGTGVSGGATSAEATQGSGVVTVKADSGNTVAVTFTDAGGRSITKTVTGTGTSQAITLASADIGTGSGQLHDGTITVKATATDALGNASIPSTATFTLDTVTPTAPALTLGTGVSGGATSAEATQTSGVVTLNAESGSSVLVTFTDGTNTVTKTITGTGAAQAVTLASSDLGTGTGQLKDGNITVSAVATDAAGNVSTSGTTSFTLDTSAPATPTLNLVANVSDGASKVEATQSSGVVTFSAEAGSNVAVTFKDGSNHTVTKTFTGTGASQAVTLTSADFGTGTNQLQDGTITVSAIATDAAGNASSAGTTTFMLDASAPATPTFALGTGVSGGATSAEATQAGGVVTVNAESGSNVVVTFKDSNNNTVTKTVTGTGASQAVTLSSTEVGQLQNGTITVSAVATDAAGNTSNAGTSTFTLDTAAPTTPTLTLGTGVSGGASSAEATQTSGVVTLNAESGSSVLVTFTDASGNTVTKTVTGTGASQAVTLTSADIGTGKLQNGTITVSAVATDAAGNASSAGTATFSLDTVAPTAIDLNANTTGMQTIESQYYRTGDVGNNKTILPNIALPTDTDVAQINIAIGGTVDETNDTLVLGTDSKLLNTTAGSGNAATIGGVSGLSWTYNTGKQLTIYKTNGAALAPSEVQAIEQALQFRTQSISATQGERTFSVTHLDAAGNASTAAVEKINVDTQGPATPTLTLGTGVSNGATSAEAVQAGGVVILNAESGSSVLVTFTDGTNTVTKTVTGTGASQAVTLTSADLGTGTNKLLDGTITVSAVATDGAGNASNAGTATFTLDTAAPTAPTLALGTGVSGGATSAEAVQAGGVVTLNAESGSNVVVTFKDSNNNTVTKTVTGTGASQAVALTATDLGTGTNKLLDGNITVSAVATDAAGNASTLGTTTFTLDTKAPTAPTLALGTGVSNGATSAEATQSGGVVTLNAESGSSVLVTFTDGTNTVTKTVTGTGASQAVTLSSTEVGQLQQGNITVSAVATDVAGNASSASTTTFKLDTAAPATPTLTLGTGVSGGATSAEATQAGGVVTLNAESGSSVLVTFTDASGNTVTKTVTGTGAPQAVTLTSTDIGTGTGKLQNGTITVSAVATDVAGNASNAGTTTFSLDTVAPAAIDLNSTVGSTQTTESQYYKTIDVGTPKAILPNVNRASDADIAQIKVTVGGTYIDPANDQLVLGGVSKSLNLIAGSGTTTLGGVSVDWAYDDNRVLTLSRNGGGTFSSADVQAIELALQFQTTAGAKQGARTFGITHLDAAGNISAESVETINVDTQGPTAPTVDLATNVSSGGATSTEAVQSSGVVTVTAESGSAVAVTFTDVSGHTVTKTLTGTGSAQAVTLTSADLGTGTNKLLDGTITVSAVATDGAGNASNAGTATFTLDTAAPTAPTLALGTGVSSGATSAEAVQAGGVVTVNAESGSTVAVTFKDSNNNTVTKTVTGTGASQAVALTATDLGTGTNKLLDGNITVSAVATDAAGNASTLGTTTFTLDTKAPTVPTVNLVANIANGASATEAVQPSGVVNVSAEVGSTIAVTFKDSSNNTVTKTITATGLTQAVTLSSTEVGQLQNGTITVSAVATDAAGNTSNAGTSTFTLDTAAPTAPTLALGTGVSGGASSAEATQAGGVVTLNAESGSSVLVTFTDASGNTVTKTVTGTGAPQAVTLTSTDVGTGTGKLQNGTITVSAVATDAAGNASNAGTTTFSLDTVAPTAIDLNANTTGTQTIESQAYKASDAGNPKYILPNVATGTDTDVAQIKVAISGSPDPANDKLLFGGATKTLNLVADSGTANFFGIAADWTYDADRVLTFSKTGGGTFTKAQVQTIEQYLQFQTSAGANQGNRIFSVTHVDSAGNSSDPSIETITVGTVIPSTPTFVLGTGVSGGATSAEATQTGGVVKVSADVGNTVDVTFTDISGHTVTQTFTGTGAQKALTLSSTDLASGGGSLVDGTITVSAVATDGVGSTSAAGTTTFTLDTTAPTLHATTKPATALSTVAGTAGNSEGETITLTVTFDGNVNGLTTGTNSTIFTVGGTGVTANWGGTDGTATRTLTYTIAAGQSGQAAIDEAQLKTALVAGIKDGAGNAFSYTATGGVIPNIDTTALPVIDATAPTVSSVAITGGTNMQSGTLNAGDVVSVTVNMSEATLVNTTGTKPQLALNIGGTTVYADYASGSGTTALVFNYTIQNNLTDTNGISIDANALRLNGGTLADAAGNTATITHAAVTDNASYLVDTTAPTVSSVAITSATGAQSTLLNAGDVVTATVNMSEATFVNTALGTPQLKLNIGGTTVLADFVSSSSGTNALQFTYRIQSGQTDANGISIDADALVLNNATLADAAGNAATTTHSLVADNTSFKVDTTAPTVSSVGITSATGSGALKVGDTVTVTATMSEATIVNTTGNKPQLALNIGGSTVYADYTSGSGTTALTFTYTIKDGQADANGISIPANALSLNGGTLADAAGNAAVITHTAVTDNASYMVDASAPKVSSVAITSATGAQANTLNAGDTVTATVTMNEATLVNTTGTKPQLALNIGGTTVYADYASGSGTTALVFTYTLPNNLSLTDTDGISIDANALTLNGGTLVDTVGNAAVLTHAAVASNASYLVDTTDPTLSSATAPSTALSTVAGTAGDSVGETITLTVTFDGNVKGLTSGTNSTIFTVGGTPVSATWGGTDNTATRTLTYTIVAGQNGQAAIDEAALKAALMAGITDGAGNAFSYTANSGNIANIDATALPVIDTTGPTLSSSAAPSTALGTAVAGTAGDSVGETITLTVTFDGNVKGLTSGTNSTIFTVGGTPVSATWGGTDNTATRTLTYTIVAGQNGQAAIDEAALKAALMAGITDGAGNAFSYTANSGNIANIDATALPVIDTTGPTLSSSAPSTALSTVAGTAGDSVGETITLTVTFDGNVKGLTSGTNSTIFTVGGTPVSATWGGTDNTATRTLTYTIVAGQNGQAAIDEAALKAALMAGITDGAGNGNPFSYTANSGNIANIDATALPVIDTTAPTVNSVAITSATGAQANTLNTGDVVTATVTMSEATLVNTTGTKPQLALNIGGTTVYADYTSGSGTTSLVFTYAIKGGQADANGISIPANALSLNGGTLADAAGNAAVITHAAVTDNASYLVDTTAPTTGALALAADTGSSASGGITKNNVINVTGLEAGATWEYSTNNGSTWTAGTGTSFTLGEGIYATGALKVRQTDAAGNVQTTGMGTNAAAITVDITAPTSAAILALKNDNGSSRTDGITTDGTINVTGLESGATWEYSTNGGANWTTGAGTSFLLSAGSYGVGNVQVRQTDAAGNVQTTGFGKNATAFTINPAPTTTLDTVTFSNDTGTSNTDLITNVASQTISGTLTANLATGETVKVSLDNGATWLNATASVGQKTWSLAPQTLSASNTTLKVKVTDNGGNDGPEVSRTYALDTAVTAVDLITATANTQATESQYYNASNAASGKAIVPNIALSTDTDIAKINIQVGGSGVDTTNDQVLFGTVTQTLNTTAASGTNITIGTVTGVDWSYSTAKLLTFSKNGGGSFTAADVQAIEQALQFKTISGATQGARTFSITHQDVAGNTSAGGVETVNVDTVGPTAVDLITATANTQATESQYYNASNAASGKAIVPNIALSTDTDIAKINVAVGGSGADTTNDQVLFGTVTQTLNTTAASGTNITIGTVTGVDWSYSADKVFTFSKNGGGTFAAADVQKIEQALQFKTTSGATQGDRTFSITHQDAAGNTSVGGVEKVTVDTIAAALDLDTTSISNNAPMAYTKGAYKTASGSYLDLGAVSLDNSKGFTLETWANITLPTSGVGRVFSLTPSGSNGNANAIMVTVSSTGALSLVINDASGTSLGSVAKTSAITTGTWAHISATYDPAFGTRLYLNGVEVASNTTKPVFSNTAYNINLGNADVSTSGVTASAPLSAAFSDARVYGNPRSVTDLKQDMGGKLDTADVNLLKAYSFNAASLISSPVGGTTTTAAIKNGTATFSQAGVPTSFDNAGLLQLTEATGVSSITVASSVDNPVKDGTNEILYAGGNAIAWGTASGSISVLGQNYNYTYNTTSKTYTFTSTSATGLTASDAQEFVNALSYAHTLNGTVTQGDRVFTLGVTDLAGNASVGVTSTIRVDTVSPTTVTVNPLVINAAEKTALSPISGVVSDDAARVEVTLGGVTRTTSDFDVDKGVTINKTGVDQALVYDNSAGTKALLGGAKSLDISIAFASTQSATVSTPKGVSLMSYSSQTVANNDLGIMATVDGFSLLLNGIQYNFGVSAAHYFDGAKHTVRVTWDSATGTASLYVDDATVAKSTLSNVGKNYTLGTNGVLMLGQEQDTLNGNIEGGQSFKGTFYNVDIDAVNATKTNSVRWKMDGVSAGVIADSGTGGYNLTAATLASTKFNSGYQAGTDTIVVESSKTWRYTPTSTDYVNLGSDGSKTITVKAFDAAGNPTTSTTGTMSVDTTAPANVTVNAAVINKTAASVIRGNASSDATMVEITIGGKVRTTTTFDTTTSTGSTDKIWIYTPTADDYTNMGADGAKTVTVRAMDAAGNFTTGVSGTITLDTSAPVVQLGSSNTSNDVNATSVTLLTTKPAISASITEVSDANPIASVKVSASSIFNVRNEYLTIGDVKLSLAADNISGNNFATASSQKVTVGSNVWNVMRSGESWVFTLSSGLSATTAQANELTSAMTYEKNPWYGTDQSIGNSANGWSVVGAATRTDNNALAPDSTITADTLNLSSANVYSRDYTGLMANTAYTYSVWVKLGTASNLNLSVNNATTANTIAGDQQYSASNGGLSTTQWTQINHSFTTDSAGKARVFLGGTDGNLAAQSTGSVYVWGGQLSQTGNKTIGDSAWTKTNATVTADVAVAPDGTQTADQIDFTAATVSQCWQTLTGLTAGQTYTYSFWVKLGTANRLNFSVNDSQTAGTIAGDKTYTAADGLNPSGWTQVNHTFKATSTGSANIHFGGADSTLTTAQGAGSVYVWGGNLRLGDWGVDKDIGGAAWAKGSSNTSQSGADTIVAPDGSTTADAVTLTATANGNDIYRQFNGLQAYTTYTYSVWAKLGTATNLNVNVNNGNADKTIDGDKAYSSADGLSTSEWTLINHTFTLDGNTSAYLKLGSASDDGSTVKQTSGTVYLWGGQLTMAGDAGVSTGLKMGVSATDTAGNTSTSAVTTIGINQPTGTLNTKALSTDVNYQTVTSGVIDGAVTNNGDAVIVRSSKLGTAYLVNTSNTGMSTEGSIKGLADNQWNSVAISATDKDINLDTTGLAAGTYKLYVADANGVLSAASSSAVKVVDGYTLSGMSNGVDVNGWNLIAPYTQKVGGVDKTFYFVDKDGNGVANTADAMNHNTLDYIFNSSSSAAGSVDTTDTNRSNSALYSGLTVSLATGDNSTAYNGGGAPTNGIGVTSYTNDLMAIWDTTNNATGVNTNGTPTGWGTSNDGNESGYYWSASGGSNGHSSTALYQTQASLAGYTYGPNGYIADSAYNFFAAVQVEQTQLQGTLNTKALSSDVSYQTPNSSSGLIDGAVTNNGDAVLVRSTKLGTAYLVNTANTGTLTEGSIKGLADNQWNSVAISATDKDTSLDTTGLAAGTYKLYVADANGVLSAASSSAVTVVNGYTLSGIVNGIDVSGWNLIAPYTQTVGGVSKTFYFVDKDGSGVANTADAMNHDTLDYIFNSNSTRAASADTTDANRSNEFLLPGHVVSLATGDSSTTYNGGATPANGTGTTSYTNDLMAIWDTVNNTTGTVTNGTPTGWGTNNGGGAGYYWAASGGSSGHSLTALYSTVGGGYTYSPNGYISDATYNGFAAVQVL